jgi:hypothetical protein
VTIPFITGGKKVGDCAGTPVARDRERIHIPVMTVVRYVRPVVLSVAG